MYKIIGCSFYRFLCFNCILRWLIIIFSDAIEPNKYMMYHLMVHYQLFFFYDNLIFKITVTAKNIVDHSDLAEPKVLCNNFQGTPGFTNRFHNTCERGYTVVVWVESNK